MTNIPKPIGRPPFRIDGKRLRDLRKEAGLSQRTLAEKANALAGKGGGSNEVLKNTAQRWESTGAVPREMAQHLAKVLGTTVAVLQGDAPQPASNRVDDFERVILARVAAGSCPELVEALDRAGRDSADDERPERSLATSLSGRLEVAQMTQASELFDEIALLTGLSVAHLRKPMSHGGFWLLVGTGFAGPERCEILSGVTEVTYEVRAELCRHFETAGQRDSHATFCEEAPWFRVTLSDARMGMNRVLRFVRCQPNEHGLQWTSATWLDRFWIDELPGNAYAHASFVTGFDGVQVPSKVTNLRLAVVKHPVYDPNVPFETNRPDDIVAVTRGDIDELPDRTMEMFEKDRQTHYLVVNWLRAGLWEVLKPLLSEWPLEFWHISKAQSRIDVHLELPLRAYMQFQVPPRQGNIFSIVLVEEVNDSWRHVPWNPAGVSHVFEVLERDFNGACTALPDIGSPAPQT
ncbi:MAG: hypothetical protein PSV40_15825 [Polaromonas sp.]|uniref:helix-turn-helix domain-containing protein n=1 Tax=Polaromonas sp. TaxID=1869339 RepID=UPI00248A76C0|nr:hypothetical protein [Polaromonas sp.]MDI1270557.1 hypothetical protein [Polaromonas sp.]